MMFTEAYRMSFDAVARDPVRETLRTRGSVTRDSPMAEPTPVTTLTTPGGSRSDILVKNSITDRHTISDGLRTTVFPAASAGAIFDAIETNGIFHGVTSAQT